jgi:outer membrane cobalamin receptor
MTPNREVSLAVQRTLTLSAVAAAGAAASVPAHSQEAPTAGANAPETVTVTGSRIRRAVDEATASPITIIDDTAIRQSGYQSTGDLLTQLPTIAGSNASTSGLNNGGGFGETTVELRGLNPSRTLILLDGRRIGIVGGPGAAGAVDVNQIPISVIDHIDVLKQGAGAVYGSDAIAGVVNFVTRKNTNGVEISGEYGRTTHNDGPHELVNLLWGGTTEKFEFLVSGTYSKQKAVYAGARDFSKDALYLYSGSSGRFVTKAGSSRVPNGRASLPAAYTLPNGQTAGAYYGCSATRTNQVTRTAV